MDLTHTSWLTTLTILVILQAVSVTLAHSGHRHEKGEQSKGNNKDNHNPTSTAPPQLPSLLRARTRADSANRQPSPRDQGGPNCCENGGLCVMGVFCHCGDKYYGFRCEFERESCGRVQHDQWVRLGCNLCRCFDARLHCLANVYSGCEGRPVNEDIQVEDYTDDMEIFAKDEDPPSVDIDSYNTDDYFYYYDGSDPLDYSEDNDSDRTNRRGHGKGEISRGRGRSRGKGDHSSASRVCCCHCVPLFSLCLLINIVFKYFSTERKEFFFVS